MAANLTVGVLCNEERSIHHGMATTYVGVDREKSASPGQLMYYYLQ